MNSKNFIKKDLKSNKKWLWATVLFTIVAIVLFSIAVKYDAHLELAKFFTAKPYTITVLSEKPPVRLYKNMISENEARHLINLAKNRLSPSSVLLEGKSTVDNYWRTSSTAHLKKSEDEVVKSIEERISNIIGCKTEYMEPLQIVHYSVGQKFLPHHDYFQENEVASQNGQREHTFLIYLNNVSAKDGGRTIFPDLNISVEPTIGTALYFRDMDEQGKVDPLTLHGGEEIITGGVEKWACNVWIRSTPFKPLAPSQ